MNGWEALRTLSLIRGLSHVVQVEETAGRWETLAAFNVERVALEYAAQCAKTGRTYRVKPLEHWVES
jgi:hypothetical protein